MHRFMDSRTPRKPRSFIALSCLGNAHLSNAIFSYESAHMILKYSIGEDLEEPVHIVVAPLRSNAIA